MRREDGGYCTSQEADVVNVGGACGAAAAAGIPRWHIVALTGQILGTHWPDDNEAFTRGDLAPARVVW